jgi:hypothetical protein
MTLKSTLLERIVAAIYARSLRIVKAELEAADAPSLICCQRNVSYTCSLCKHELHGWVVFYNVSPHPDYPEDIASSRWRQRYACPDRRACRRRVWNKRFGSMLAWIRHVKP